MYRTLVTGVILGIGLESALHIVDGVPPLLKAAVAIIGFAFATWADTSSLPQRKA